MMRIQTVDITVLLFFLVIFVIISRFKDNLKEEDESGFKQITAGMSMLAMAAIFKAFGSSGLFDSVPFLADEAGINIVLWIVVVSGIILLSSGLSSWLPLAQTYRKFNLDKVEKLGAFKRLEQLIRVESRLQPLLERTVEHINTVHHFSSSAAILFGSKSKQKKVVALAKDSTLSSNQIEDFEYEVISRSRGRNEISVRYTDKGEGAPAIVATISVIGKPVGAILGWPSEETDDKVEAVRDIKLIADMIGRKLELDVSTMTNSLYSDLAQAKQQIREIIASSNNIRTFLPFLKSVLKSLLDFEILSVSLTKPDASSVRYSIGRNGAVLEEIGVHVNRSIGNELISVPLLEAHGIIGSLSICPTTKTKPSVKEKIILQSIAEGVSDLASFHIRHEQELMRTKVTADLRKIQLTLDQEFELKDVYTRVTNLLVKEAGVDMVRICTVGDDENFISSKIMRLGRQVDVTVPETGLLVRSLMPLVESVIVTGRDMTVDRSSGLSMTTAEKSQLLFNNVGSSMIIPLKKNQKVRGVIAIGMTAVTPISADLKQVVIMATTVLESAMLTRTLRSASVIGKPLVARRGPETTEVNERTANRVISGIEKTVIDQGEDDNELVTLVKPSERITRSDRVSEQLITEKIW